MKKLLPVALTEPISLTPAMRLISSASVVNPKNGRSVTVNALWDTGAAMTFLAKSKAEDLGLELKDKRRVVSAFGAGSADIALASVYVCVGGMPMELYIGILDDRDRTDPDIQLTIGLDLICMGDFAVSHDDEGFPIFSFAYPSGSKIDFKEFSDRLGLDVASEDFSNGK